MRIYRKLLAVFLLLGLFAMPANAQLELLNPLTSVKVLQNAKKLTQLARKATQNYEMKQAEAIAYWTKRATEKNIPLAQDGSTKAGIENLKILVDFAKREMEGGQQVAENTAPPVNQTQASTAATVPQTNTALASVATVAPKASVAQPTTQPKMTGGVKVVLTGTYKEPITMVFAGSRTETITYLPYTFFVPKQMLPNTATFTSANYDYADITVNKKEDGGIGRTYVLKSTKKTAMSAPTQVVQQVIQQVPATPVVEEPKIDWSHGVNAVPTSGTKSDNTFALIIANEEYEMVAPVAMANFDGEVFKAYCEKTLGLSENQIKYYPNASYGKMSRAFREIKDIADAFKGDINLIIYYAGHGIPDNATKDAYIMPVDADGTDVGVCYSLQKMYKDIEDLHINQCVVFMDACFSGAKRGGDMIVAARGVAIKAKEAKPKSSTIVFSATSDEQAAYSYEQEKHGLFTYFLLKKLQETNGKATLGDIADYLSNQVAKNSIVINGKKQTPTITVSDDIQENWKKLKLTN